MVSIRVNGETFTRFKQLDCTVSIDTFAREMRIISTISENDDSFIKIDDDVEIFFDGFPVLAGYIEKIGDVEDSQTHDISYRARSRVSDLIDSYVPENVKSLEKVSKFADLVQLCIDGIGATDKIKVFDEVGAVLPDKIKAGETGQKIGDFLQQNARLVQVFLNTDGKGNVVIKKPSGHLKTLLQNIPNDPRNNIKKSNLNIDHTQRFNKYIIYSNGSLTDDPDGESLDVKGSAVDKAIRESRVFEKISEKPMTADECQKAAAEEANIRRARAFSYNCEVVGFSENGELWEPGKTATVKDKEKGIFGTLALNTLTYNYSESGEKTSFNITLPDKESGEANATTQTDRIVEVARTYTVKKGDNLWQLAKDRGIKLADLIQANPQIKTPRLIYIGQQIKIPTVT